MKILLDTHIFIWYVQFSNRLSRPLYEMLQDPSNTLLMSVAVMWEIQIKAQKGRLSFPLPPHQFVPAQVLQSGINMLPVREKDVWMLDQLPLHHGDPFDRIMLAQAMVEGCHFASVDGKMSAYNVPLLR